MRGVLVGLLIAFLAGVLPVSAQVAGDPPAAGAATPGQLREFGYALMQTGDLAGAWAVADALLARDPADTAALMLRSQLALLGGDEARARTDARQVWRLSDRPGPKFGAAMMVAQSLAADGYHQRGQFWLRRAAQSATTEEQAALVADAFARMRSRSPLKWSVSLSVRPSSNVNSGSSETSFTLPGLPILLPELPIPGAQQALSGTEASFAADLTWRLVPTATTMTAFHLRLDQTVVRLSSEAKAMAPGLRGGDFDRASVEFGVTRRWRPEGNKAIWTFGAFAVRDWSGGESLANSLRFSVQAERPLGARSLGFVSAMADRQHRLDAGLRSTGQAGLNFGLQHQLAGKDVVTLIFGLRDVTSDSPGLRNSAALLRLGWRKAEPVAGLGIEAWLAIEGRDYPDSPWRPDGGRRDLRASLDLGFEFTRIQYMGFSPVLNLSASHVDSNVGLYESRELGVQVGFRSAF